MHVHRTRSYICVCNAAEQRFVANTHIFWPLDAEHHDFINCCRNLQKVKKKNRRLVVQRIKMKSPCRAWSSRDVVFSSLHWKWNLKLVINQFKVSGIHTEKRNDRNEEHTTQSRPGRKRYLCSFKHDGNIFSFFFVPRISIQLVKRTERELYMYVVHSFFCFFVFFNCEFPLTNSRIIHKLWIEYSFSQMLRELIFCCYFLFLLCTTRDNVWRKIPVSLSSEKMCVSAFFPSACQSQYAHALVDALVASAETVFMVSDVTHCTVHNNTIAGN